MRCRSGRRSACGTVRAGRTAVLADLENVLHGPDGLLDPSAAGDVIDRALALAGHADYRIAIAPPGVLRRYVRQLAAAHLPCEAVAAGPDAADMALLNHADHLISIGYTRFVVLSADHVFSELCRLHPTTVIARDGQPIARELRRTAAAVLAA